MARVHQLALCLLLLAGCALQKNVVRASVGRATRFDVLNRVEGVLNRYGYTVQGRRDTGTTIQLITGWQNRAPFEDEAGRGATECRTRLTVDARPQGNDMFAVILRAENEIQAADGSWKPDAPAEMFRAHVADVSNALA